MTIIPTIVSGLFSLLLWFYLRKSFRRHVIDVFAINGKWIYFFDLFTIFCVSTRFLLRFEGDLKAGRLIPVIVTASYVALGFLGLFVLMLIAMDLGDLVTYLKNKIKKNAVVINNETDSRRNFLKKNITLATIASSSFVTGVGFGNSFDPKKVEVKIPLKTSHLGLTGLRIVQLSDIHIGPTLRSEFATLLVERVNAMEPDLIVITGDMIDGRVHDIGKELEPFKNFKSKMGTYFITGNHEYYWYSSEWTQFASELGMKVLNNENVKLEYKGAEFYLAGVSDISSRKLDPENACNLEKAKLNVPEEAYSILLSHQPKTCFEACKLRYNLQLSGHTHGGQGFPWNIIVHLVQPYVKGLHEVDGMHLYVSSGTGFWGPPNRFMVNSEITEIVFTA
jgi:predicted MPP superfamily phosphohydrolase